MLRRLAWLAKPLALACALAATAHAAREQPAAVGGILDLRGWEFERDGAVELRGDWELVWQRYDDLTARADSWTPATTVAGVPGPWNGLPAEGRSIGAEGYGTYRLTILCNAAPGMGLLLPTVHSAMRLYVNGRLVAAQGNPGTTREATRAAVARDVVALGEQSCPLRLVMHVANFQHRHGGLVESPRLGDAAELALQRERGRALDVATIGAFGVMGVVMLLFFLIRRRDPTPLWFALYCLGVGAHVALTKERVAAALVFPAAGWEAWLKAQTIAVIVATAALVLFARALYARSFPRSAVRAVAAASLAALAAVVALPARWHTLAEPATQAFTVGAALWLVAVLAWLSWRRRSVWPALLAAAALCYPVLMLDLWRGEVALAMIVAPALVLAQRFSRALNAEELRSIEERGRADLMGRATKAGLLDWNAGTGTNTYSERLKEMLGYPPDADTSRWDFFEFIHPEERELARGLFRSHLRDAAGARGGMRQHTPWDYRLRRADGAYIWVHAESLSITGDDGRTLRYLASFIDITEHRAIEQTLRDQIALTQAIVAQTPNAIFVKDRQGRFTMVNRGWSQMSGVPEAQAVGRTVHDLYPKETAERFAAEDERLLAQGASAQPIESLHQGPRDPGQWRIVRKAVLSREDGSVLGLIATSTDISELKRIEAELRDQMVLTAALFDDNPNAMYLKDTEGRYVKVNDAWLKMVGLTRSQAIGHTVLELFPEKESERYHAADMELIAKGEGFDEMESRRTGPAGEPQWVIIRKRVLRRADGSIVGLMGVNTDITHLKRIEGELAERAKFISGLVDSMPISVAMRDTEGRYVLVNRTWERYFGVKREDALGRRRRELPGWSGDASRLADADEIENLDREMLARGPDYVPEPQETLRLGRHYLITRRALFDSAGKPIGVVSAGFDNTERRAMEEALKDSVRLREEVERMSRHDLKTPLNSVIAVSRLLREGGKLSREDEELLSIVERAGYRILSMVNLSLDLFRMESGTYQFRAQAIDMMDVARKVAADLEGQAASKNVALSLRQSGSSLARAEELLCYSMLANLVKNAIEATPEGGVVSVTVEGAGDRTSVHVHNPGAVPAAVRARFFDKYASAGKSAGLGLGTYSARLMARVQEGDITLHTSEDAGTTVSVRLGAARAAEAAPVPAAATGTRAERLPKLKRQRVLVVDDDEFNRLVLRRYLPSPPLTLAMAVNGRAALDAARAHWPDVVLLDLEMPVMDGYEAAQKLRQMERDGGRKRLTIVAISSNDDEAIVRRALAAGCDHYVVKPAPRETLFRVLAGERVAPSRAPATVEGPPPPRVQLEPRLKDKIPDFLASRRALLGEAAAAAGAGDRAALRRLAHRLAGSFALFGFDWASARSRFVEQQAAVGELAELGARLGAVREHLDRVEIGFRHET